MELIIIIAYIFITLFCSFCLLNTLQIFDFTSPNIKKILYLLSQFYDSLNPLAAVLMVSYFTIYYFIKQDGTLYLFTSGILVLISFILNMIKWHFVARHDPPISAYSDSEHYAALSYIETYNEIEKYKKNLYSVISDGVTRFIKHNKEAEGTLTKIATTISDYVLYQNTNTKSLVKHQQSMERAFDHLKNTASNFEREFKKLLKILDVTGLYLEHPEDNYILLTDIKSTFKESYVQNNNEVYQQIQYIIDRLNTVINRIGDYRHFPKPYKDSIALLSRKMENAINSFNDKNHTKQEETVKLCNELANILIAQNRNIIETKETTLEYLTKNSFVLSKVISSFNISCISEKPSQEEKNLYIDEHENGHQTSTNLQDQIDSLNKQLRKKNEDYDGIVSNAKSILVSNKQRLQTLEDENRKLAVQNEDLRKQLLNKKTKKQVKPVPLGQASQVSPAKPVHKKEYHIGDRGPAGGIVFYDKGKYSGGWRYLEAAPASTEFQAPWDEAMVKCEQMQNNGFGGWRLPTKDELNRLYTNLNKNGLGGFGDELYWSSSEFNNRYRYVAYSQNFSDGMQYGNYKTRTFSVRAVRTF